MKFLKCTAGFCISITILSLVLSCATIQQVTVCGRPVTTLIMPTLVSVDRCKRIVDIYGSGSIKSTTIEPSDSVYVPRPVVVDPGSYYDPTFGLFNIGAATSALSLGFDKGYLAEV